MFTGHSGADVVNAGIGDGLLVEDTLSKHGLAPNFEYEFFGKGVRVVHLIGNLYALGVTADDIFGKGGLRTQYNDCMAGKEWGDD